MANEGLVALDKNIVVVLGGVGGAKLAAGLAQILPARRLTFVVNTGDDFWHLGLRICPDLDTVRYTLARLVNPDWGWGLQGDSVVTLEALHRFYGVDTWFRLGDADLALHLHRRTLLGRGLGLTTVTREIAARLGVRHAILPMSDDPVRTRVLTPDGPLAFQHYFVRDRCEPRAVGFEFTGAETAGVNPAIPFGSVSAVVICPSNPSVSVDPILAVNALPAALRATGPPIVAVSPIVSGRALKAPTATLMRQLARPTTTSSNLQLPAT